MPIVTFDIESYTVLTTQSGNTAAGAYRHLSLTSPDLSHGIRTRASIFFFEGGSTTAGVVYNVDQPNFNGLTAYSYCHKADFGQWYDILRNERPLKCSFAYDGPDYDPNVPTRNLYWIQMFTGMQEPPGEGAEEVHAMLFPKEVLEQLRGGGRDA